MENFAAIFTGTVRPLSACAGPFGVPAGRDIGFPGSPVFSVLPPFFLCQGGAQTSFFKKIDFF
ncbi:MAG: hypothetical protein ACLTWO_03680 [Blautia massiliensis (ex Durand et al. 2017)]